jgi:hypothetical protein
LLTVKAEDADLLAIMNELESVEENIYIEEDSLLGGLTQSLRNPITIGDDDNDCKNIFQNSESDVDDEETMNFTLPLLANDLDNSKSSHQSTIEYGQRPDRIIEGNEIQLESIERINRTSSNIVKTLAELKDIQISKLSTVRLHDELITEILENPPQLCISKTSNCIIENLKTKSQRPTVLPETNIANHAEEKNKELPETFGFVDEHVVMTPFCCPPPPYNIKKYLVNHNIPEKAEQHVFYSDIEDLSAKQEVGHIVLQILSNKLVHTITYVSLLPELLTIEHIRKGLIFKLNRKTKNTNFDEKTVRFSHTSSNEKNFKSFLSENSECLIVSNLKPPTIDDAIIWRDSKESVQDVVKPIPQPADAGKKNSQWMDFGMKNSQTNHTVHQRSNYGSISFYSGHPIRKKCLVLRNCRSLIDTSFVQYSEKRQLITAKTTMANINSKQTKHEKRIQNRMEEPSDSNDSMNLTVSHNEKKINRRRGLVSSQKKEGINNIRNLRKRIVSP